MSKGKYVLEVLEFKKYENSNIPRLIHLGYMKRKFKTKKDAVSYYDINNQHMRSLNAHNNYKSDWDPITRRVYIVRDNYLINETIDCFSIDDNIEISS